MNQKGQNQNVPERFSQSQCEGKQKNMVVSSFAISNSSTHSNSNSPQYPKFVLNLQSRILNPFSNFLKAVTVTTKQRAFPYTVWVKRLSSPIQMKKF